MHCSTGSTFDTVSDSSNQEYEKHSLHFRPCTHSVQTVRRGSACLISGRTKQNKLKRELKHTKVVAAATFEVEYHSQTEVTTACLSFSFCCRLNVSGAPSRAIMPEADSVGQQVTAIAAPATQHQSTPLIKGWVAWMLFGLGWISLFLFGMSLIPFGATARMVLVFFAVPFLACWWAAAILGTGDNLSSGQKHAWRANLIMALVGSSIAALYAAGYLYYHSPAFSSVLIAAAIYAALHFYSQSLAPATAAAAPSDAGEQ